MALRGFLHLFQDGGTDLAGSALFALGIDPGIAIVRLDDGVRHHVDVLLDDRIVEPAADQALYRKDRIGWIGDRLALGRHAHQGFTITMEGVVRMPSSFSITRAFLPSMIATQLLVVPRSIPIILLLMPHFHA